MATLNAVQEKLFTWYDKIHEAHEAMPEEERQEIAEWERTHLDGSMMATSDWPGWEKYIGKRPAPTSYGVLLHPQTMIGRLIFSELPYPCNTCRRGKELGLGELAELVELRLL